jgi:cis-3-alkyl-4-acyloxetan-2-one decarboxylase
MFSYDPLPDSHCNGSRVQYGAYSFRSRRVPVAGTFVHCVDQGEGDPVVMLHGNPTWSFMYRELIAGLHATHRTIAIDHVGMGLSGRPDDARYEYRLKSRIDDLESALAQLDVDKNITLILHDWGGLIGLGYAARYPERVARVVLLNTAAFHLPENKRVPLALRICRVPILGSTLVRRLNLFARDATWLAVTRRLPRDVRTAYLTPYRTWDDRRAIHRFVQDIPLAPDAPSYALVGEIERSLRALRQRPVLICWGMRDPIFTPDILTVWQRFLPEATVQRFPDAGHYILEDAGAQVREAVSSFIRETAHA